MIKMVKTYLLGIECVKELSPDGSICAVSPEVASRLKKLTKKEVALRSKGLAVADASGNICYREGNSHLQHFFPILIRDYAYLSYENARYDKPFPIISIDSHDVIGCDFKCQDCLSGAGMAVTKTPSGRNFNMPLEFYLHILSEVASYSKKRGIDAVRFEQSGEGNPDIYPARAELIRQAKKRFNMQSVYVSTGSMLTEDEIVSLVENAAFIRISFPGVDPRSYALYSNQDRFTFDDSMRLLNKLIRMRREIGRENDLLIGARAALRPENDPHYYNYGLALKEAGVDCVQIVKILVPEGTKHTDYPLSQTCKNQLEQLKTLSDTTFNVSLPHVLDYLYYERRIEDKSVFPSTCYSVLVQPVLTGRGLFVCTKSEIMYSEQYRLGNFEGKGGEIEGFLDPANIEKVAGDFPKSCGTCSNIFDNTLLDDIRRLTLRRKEDLSFYEVIVHD